MRGERARLFRHDLVVVGGYGIIAVALTKARIFSGCSSWQEGFGGILVLLGTAMMWSGAGGWLASLEEVEVRPSPLRRLRKFEGDI